MNNKKMNSLSIIGFIASFFSIIISSIICFIALTQIREHDERGKGFAIAGIVLNLIKILSIVLLVILLIVMPARSETEYKCEHSKNCTLNSDGTSYTCIHEEDGLEEYITCNNNTIEEKKVIENYGADDDYDDTFDYDRE